MFAVNFWGSHPDEQNDDCWTGADFDTIEEAVACFDAPVEDFSPAMDMSDVAYVELDGPHVHVLRRIK